MAETNIKKNTIYNILKTVSSVIFPLVTFPYVSRVLKPENVGKINFGNSIVSYFSLFATLGITTYAVRECAKVKSDKKKLGKISSQIISINLFTTIITYILLIVLLCLYERIRDYRLLIAIQSINIICTTAGADWLNAAMEDFKYITIRTIVFQIVSLILMFTLIHKPEDYIKYAVITVIASSGANITNIFYRRRYCRIRVILKCDFKRHIPPIIGLFAMLVAQQIFTMCDTTIIGLILGDYEVGLYSTAIKVYSVINQVMTSITWVVMPQLSIAFVKNNVTELKRILKYVLQFSSIIGIPSVIGMFMLSSEIISVVGGESYVGAVAVLRILALTLLSGLASNFTLNVNLLAAGRDTLCLIICVIASALNIVTNLIFIPLYGINAAAVTTCISQTVIAMISLPFLDKRLFSIDLIKTIMQPLAASAGLFIVVLVVHFFGSNTWLNLTGSIVLGGSFYFSILIFFKNEMVIGFVNSLSSKIKKQQSK